MRLRTAGRSLAAAAALAVLSPAAVLAAAPAAKATAPPATPKPAPSATAKPSAPPAPAPVVPELFVTTAPNPDGSIAVAIDDAAGVAHASATYTQPGPAADLRPGPISAAGAAWWVDSQGGVWSLAPGGPPVHAATLKGVGPNTIVSLAVSPGGAAIAAALVTLPPAGAPPQYPATTEVDVVRNGVTVRTRWGDDGNWYDDGILELVGWDIRGPVAVANAQPLAGGGAHGRPVQIDLAGHSDGDLGPQSCHLDTLLPDGTTLCGSDYSTTVTAQRLDGTAIATAPVPTDARLTDEVLSPDARRIAQDGRVWENGSFAALPDGFRPQGWLDARTVIGLMAAPGAATPELAVVQLAHADQATALSVRGVYAGTLGADLITDPASQAGATVRPPARPGPPPPTTLQRLEAWLKTSQGISCVLGAIALALAWHQRHRIDRWIDDGIAMVRTLPSRSRTAASQLYHRYTDFPDEALAKPAAPSRRTGLTPPVVEHAGTPPLFAAALMTGPAAPAVAQNPVSFDRFCIFWLATSHAGRRYVIASTSDLDPSTPWPRRLETATRRLQRTPYFKPVAEELVGPWMNSEFRDVAKVGAYSSARLQAIFSTLLGEPVAAR